MLAGPRAQGGPWLLQLWRRSTDGGFERVHAGNGSIRSAVIGAWLVPDRSQRVLRIADCEDGTEAWLTLAERAQRGEREARESERQARESERQARESAAEALRRVAELEAKLRDR
jgi:hypothetical protein